MADARSGTAAALIRTVLIGYGTIALSVLLARSGMQQAPVPLALIAVGIGLQVVLVFARAWRRGAEADGVQRAQIIDTLELLADGVTVLLFAIATLGGVTGAGAPL